VVVYDLRNVANVGFIDPKHPCVDLLVEPHPPFGNEVVSGTLCTKIVTVNTKDGRLVQFRIASGRPSYLSS
jgi:hypothetical protein